jgi:hypothetical protein
VPVNCSRHFCGFVNVNQSSSSRRNLKAQNKFLASIQNVYMVLLGNRSYSTPSSSFSPSLHVWVNGQQIDEDSTLKDAVEKHNGEDWAAIAALVPGRTKQQCLNRWHYKSRACR